MRFAKRLWLAAALSISAVIPSHADVAEKALNVTAKIPRSGDFLGYGFESVWMMSGSKLARVNPADNSVTDIPIKGSMGRVRAFQIGDEAVWVPDIAADLLFKVDPTKNAVTMAVPVPMEGVEASIGVGLGSVWVVADGKGDGKQLLRIDSATGVEQAKITLPGRGAGVIVAFESVWVSAPLSKQVYRIDPSKNALAQIIEMSQKPRFLTADERAVWVSEHDGYLQSIDGRTGEVVATVKTGLDEAGDVASGGGFVWISTHTLALLQIDPNTSSVVAKFPTKNFGAAVRYGAGSLWISGPFIHRIALP